MALKQIQNSETMKIMYVYILELHIGYQFLFTVVSVKKGTGLLELGLIISFVLLSGAAVDSTVSEPEQQGNPTSTPANSLRLLHLSGQGTLVQESLSQ